MAKCGICGTDVTFDVMQYSVPDFEGRKHRVCKACVMKTQGKALKYDAASGRVIVVEQADIEIRKRCNVCGHIFCYNPVDLVNNENKRKQAIFSAMGSLGGAMTGHYAAAAIHQGNINQNMNAITDYNKCPRCGSLDLCVIRREEAAFNNSAQTFPNYIPAPQNNTQIPPTAVSAATGSNQAAFCPNCGRKFQDAERFCVACGTKR